jgi:glycosyltransferase involved in cell wall biosynthesis
MKIAIIIPTYDRVSLLSRLLESIAEAEWPDSLIGVWVVENAKRTGTDEVVKRFKAKITVNYLYEEQAGPSFARNKGVQEVEADFYIFFDDDIRIAKQTLVAYENAFVRHQSTAFFGGPLLIDYEVEPEQWLLSYLPWSAQGMDLGKEELVVDKACFLGANHAIPKIILERCGGFDQFCPVGQAGPMGEETRLQQRILDASFNAVYVPDAMVWHYVPEVRCSEQWVFERQFRHGLTEASLLPASSVGKKIFHMPLWILSEYSNAFLAYFFSLLSFALKEEKFTRKFRLMKLKGMLDFFRKRVIND